MAKKISPGVKKVLKKARDLLASGRWVQSSYGEYGHNVCAVGAVRHVLAEQRAKRGKSDPEDWDLCEPIPGDRAPLRALSRAFPECWTAIHSVDVEDGAFEYSIPEYNDTKGRTAEDVIALFDFAIKGQRMPSPKEPND